MQSPSIGSPSRTDDVTVWSKCCASTRSGFLGGVGRVSVWQATLCVFHAAPGSALDRGTRRTDEALAPQVGIARCLGAPSCMGARPAAENVYDGRGVAFGTRLVDVVSRRVGMPRDATEP
jgi:hypothetical protein